MLKNTFKFIFAFILILSTQTVYAQFIIDDFKDLQAIDRCFQEREALQNLSVEKTKTIFELENALSLEKRTNELNQREIDIQKRMLEVREQEIEMQKRAFGDMKEVADRALKLAEAKKSSLWETWGPLSVIAIIVVTIASVL